ncbi:MAG: hypothetical protein NWR42_03220 [Desulfobacterales bacterium]|nr:hypothetical protein [Desulfobacterales bacterium]
MNAKPAAPAPFYCCRQMALFCNRGANHAGGVIKSGSEDVTGLQNHLCGPRDKASAQVFDILEFAENVTLLDRELIRALNAAVVGH